MGTKTKVNKLLSIVIALIFLFTTILAYPPKSVQAQGMASINTSSSPSQKNENKQAGLHPPSEKPYTKEEIINKRTANSTHYLMSDGTIKAEIYSGNIHYEDSLGHYQDIDTTLYDVSKPIKLDDNISKEVYHSINKKTERGYKPLRVGYNALMPYDLQNGYSIALGNDTLKFIPIGANSSKGIPNIDKSSIDYIDSWSNTDVNLKATDSGIKETITLKNNSAPSVFSFEVLGNLDKFHLEPAWLEDKNGEKRDVQQVLREDYGKLYLDMSFDVTGLEYPIIIDPTVTLTSNSVLNDTYIWSEYPSTVNGSVITAYAMSTNGYARALYQFDLSSIPTNAAITAATLKLFVTTAGYDCMQLYVEAITSSWSESTATWLYPPNTLDMQTPATMLYVSSAGYVVDFNVLAATQRYTSGQAFYGYCLRTPNGNVAFGTKEQTDPARRPSLVITYNLPPTAPVVTYPNGGETWNAQHNITWNAATDAQSSDVVEIQQTSEYGSLSIITGRKRAQLFTMANLHSIKSVEFKGYATGGTGYVTVKVTGVLGGLPNESVVYANITNVQIPTNVIEKRVDIPTPFSVPPGTQLALVIENTGVNTVNVQYQTPDNYAGGCLCTYDGSSWSSGSADLYFKIYTNEATGQNQLQYNIQLSPDNGSTWPTTIVTLTNPGASSYPYDFSSIPQTSQAKIRIRAYDGSAYGPWDESEVFSIYHDTTPPELTLTPDITDWTNGDVVITANATDTEGGVKQIQLPNGSWVTGSTANYTVSDNGTYTFKAEDNQGNISTENIIINNIDTTPPDTVSNFTLTPETGNIRLSWDPVSNARSYDVEIDGVITDNGTSTIYESAFEQGDDHLFRVRAKNAAGTGEWSNTLVGQAKYALPPAPANLTSTPAGTCIVINWDQVTGALGYDLELDGQVVDIKMNTSYKHTGLKLNTQHAYRVRARNIEGSGDWSPLLTVMTTAGLPGVPTDITFTQTNTSVTINWNAATDAETYDIVEVINGQEERVVDNGSPTTCEKRGLNPSSTYTYKIRGQNSIGAGPWSEPITITTYLLDTPSGIFTNESDTSIVVTWNQVEDATSYIITINDTTQITTATNNITLTELTPETKYTFQIKATNANGESGLSDVTCTYTTPIKPAVPQNVTATVSDTLISVTWDTVDYAEGYDVELDGILMEDDDDPIYIHEGLESDTLHAYKVRARNAAIEGDWSETQYIKTLPGEPVPPQNIEVKSTTTGATLTWSKKDSDLSFDLEISDGTNTTIVTDIAKNTFTHRRTGLGLEYTYRIRTRNMQGISDWSGKIINNALRAWCTKSETIDLGLTAKDVTDFSPYTMVVTYNPSAIDMIDLSSLTGQYETVPGKIEGTDIEITDFTPGKITFVVNKVVTPGEAWTGVLNSIKFKAKATGGTTITYTVFSKSEQLAP